MDDNPAVLGRNRWDRAADLRGVAANQIVISGLHVLGQSSSTIVNSEQTGTLNNDRIVAGLSDTSKFMAGTTTVSGTGIPTGTRVSAVDSASQIHISDSANRAGNSRLIFSGITGAQAGLKLGPGTQYRLTDVVLDDWIDCVDAQGGAGSAGVGRSAFTNVLCGQSAYPNPSNPTRYGVYSYSAGRGGGQLQMMDWLQGEIRGQINYASQYYTATGTTGRNGTWFDFRSKFWLWQSNGIQVYIPPVRQAIQPDDPRARLHAVGLWCLALQRVRGNAGSWRHRGRDLVDRHRSDGGQGCA